MVKTGQDKIAAMKRWAAQNYDRGADTMVECWTDADYQRVLDRQRGSLNAAMKVLRDIASVYCDQQADARYERRAAGCSGE